MVMLQYSGGRNLSGYTELVSPDSPTESGETISCVHCQFMWVVKPGSGIKRGWCFKCDKPVCGKKACVERCAPWEKQMEEAENKARFWRQMGRLR